MKRSPMNRGSSALTRTGFKRKAAASLNPFSGSTIKRGRKKRATAAEKRHMGIVARYHCIVCRNLGLGESPAELHHPRFLAGGGQRASHMDVIPLCANHHRLGGHGVAFHAGPEEFERRYGTEAALLEQTRNECSARQEAA